MPTWLLIAVPAIGFAAIVLLLVAGVCRAAKDADELLDELADRRMLRERGHVAEVVQFPRERRRSHARNGIGGPAA